jgi:predicted phage-related endonuclease
MSRPTRSATSTRWGGAVESLQILKTPNTFAWAFASLDRVSARKGEKRIVELKTNPWSRWGVGEPVPGDVQAQVQHQLWVTGYDVADVAVLVRGYELHIHEIPRDDAFIDDLVYLEREFWRWVESKTRPPVDGSIDTQKALQRMFPREYGDIVPATPEFEELADRLYIETALAKAAADREATVKNAIRALLGDAAGVAGADWKITWTKNKDAQTTDWKAVAAAYRLLLRAQIEKVALPPEIEALGGARMRPDTLDAIESLHTATKPGARVLRPWFSNQRQQQEEIAA